MPLTIERAGLTVKIPRSGARGCGQCPGPALKRFRWHRVSSPDESYNRDRRSATAQDDEMGVLHVNISIGDLRSKVERDTWRSSGRAFKSRGANESEFQSRRLARHALVLPSGVAAGATDGARSGADHRFPEFSDPKIPSATLVKVFPERLLVLCLGDGGSRIDTCSLFSGTCQGLQPQYEANRSGNTFTSDCGWDLRIAELGEIDDSAPERAAVGGRPAATPEAEREHACSRRDWNSLHCAPCLRPGSTRPARISLHLATQIADADVHMKDGPFSSVLAVAVSSISIVRFRPGWIPGATEPLPAPARH